MAGCQWPGGPLIDPPTPTADDIQRMLNEAWARIPPGGSITTDKAVRRVRIARGELPFDDEAREWGDEWV